MAITKAFQIPSTLKLSVLRAGATKCGIQVTGSKSVLIHRLLNEILSPPVIPEKAKTRLLSIDMGIRNLAYCILDVPHSAIEPSPSQNIQNSGLVKAEIPTLQAWHRFAVSSAPKNDLLSGEPAAKEAFDPATLSKIAYEVLRHRLLLLSPDIVLIERQRFRSMGSKHILEWTVRVNMFESMLYATLHTLREEKLWHGRVIPITPGKVGPFWVGEESEFLNDSEKAAGKRKIRTSKSAKAKNKGAKIDLVREWCETDKHVGWGNDEVKNMAMKYREKWDARPGGGRKKSSDKITNTNVAQEQEKMGKLDDLADCLLQGMAWVEWEKNKRLALNHGFEALID